MTFSFGGVDVIESPYVLKRPKMLLSADVPVSDEFRIKMNAWMADFFGYEEQCIIVGNKHFVSPEVYKKLKKEILKDYPLTAGRHLYETF